jgi:hypothetical protein
MKETLPHPLGIPSLDLRNAHNDCGRRLLGQSSLLLTTWTLHEHAVAVAGTRKSPRRKRLPTEEAGRSIPIGFRDRGHRSSSAASF